MTAILGIMLVVIGYVSMRGSPYLAELSFMPLTVGRWLDGNPHLRHAMGYGALTIFCGSAFWSGRPLRTWLVWGGALLLLAAAFEAAQIFLPRRHADWQDLLASWTGVLAGGGAAWGFQRMPRGGEHQ